ncbi:MAG: FAD-dependent monooxygenase [Solirubrobacteraceae bacterium]
MHVVTTERRSGEAVYNATLLRRSYREGGKVKKETLANLSHLPPEAIDAIRLGLIDEFRCRSLQLSGLELHTSRRAPVRVPYRELETPYPFQLCIPQNMTQEILDRELARLGVAIERGARVIGVQSDENGADVSFTAAGGEQSVRAAWVAGCDGSHSVVRHALGVSFDGEDYGQDWLMAECDLYPEPTRDHSHFFIATAKPFVALPLPSGRFWIFLPQVPDRGASERRPPDEQEIERLVAERGPAGLRLENLQMLSTFRCGLRRTSTMRRGRVLIAGDAAHSHSPAGGQGLNAGLQDARNLGWKLALVARGLAPATLLDSYQAERAPVAAGVLALSDRWVKMFHVPSARRRRARDLALPLAASVPTLRRRFIARTSQLSHSYRGGPLATAQGRRPRGQLADGDRLPAVDCLTRDGEPLMTLDLIAGPAHTLLILAGDSPESESIDRAIARCEKLATMSGRS